MSGKAFDNQAGSSALLFIVLILMMGTLAALRMRLSSEMLHSSDARRDRAFAQVVERVVRAFDIPEAMQKTIAANPVLRDCIEGSGCTAAAQQFPLRS